MSLNLQQSDEYERERKTIFKNSIKYKISDCMTCLAQKGNPFSRNGPKLHRKLFVSVDNFINELVLRNIKRNFEG